MFIQKHQEIKSVINYYYYYYYVLTCLVKDTKYISQRRFAEVCFLQVRDDLQSRLPHHHTGFIKRLHLKKHIWKCVFMIHFMKEVDQVTKYDLWASVHAVIDIIPVADSGEEGCEETQCGCPQRAACKTVRYVSLTDMPGKRQTVSSPAEIIQIYTQLLLVHTQINNPVSTIRTFALVKSDLLTGSFSRVLKTEKGSEGSGSDSTAAASCCCPQPLVWRDLTCVTCRDLIELIGLVLFKWYIKRDSI